MKRTTHRRANIPQRSQGRVVEESWGDYSDGQGVMYSLREPDPIPLGIIKLERDASLETGGGGPYEMYVVVRVKARNDWGITQFELVRPYEQKSPYTLEQAQQFYNRLVQGEKK